MHYANAEQLRNEIVATGVDLKVRIVGDHPDHGASTWRLEVHDDIDNCDFVIRSREEWAQRTADASQRQSWCTGDERWKAIGSRSG